MRVVVRFATARAVVCIPVTAVAQAARLPHRVAAE
ncbi:MAG: hypothetical protein JWO70_4794 [Betaproteobacteria bacterium]|nr:hypothetical protein [Betaproteobacteria bacterium]